MTRRLPPDTPLVVASHKPGKVREIIELVAPFGLSIRTAAELGRPGPAETGSSFVANAELKARAAAEAAGLPALADDSGLEVVALGGAPGIYSARWAGADKDFGVAMQRVHDELAQRAAWQPPGPFANFTAALCLAWPDGEVAAFEGKVNGHLVWPPRGSKGFGYDPMFVPDGESLTFGEMEPDAKHAMSHRARAFERFVCACLNDA